MPASTLKTGGDARSVVGYLMPTPHNGQSTLLVAIDRGPGAPQNRCGRCPAAQDDPIGNRPPHCARFGQQCEGTPDIVLRCPACLSAEAAHAELIADLADTKHVCSKLSETCAAMRSAASDMEEELQCAEAATSQGTNQDLTEFEVVKEVLLALLGRIAAGDFSPAVLNATLEWACALRGLLKDTALPESPSSQTPQTATPDPHGPEVRALVQRIATLDVTHLADCNLQEELLAALAEDATLKGW